MSRALVLLLISSFVWKGCMSVMCYWCSGVGDDRECETRPYAVRTGPVYLNCRANFCLSAKVIDAETGRVKSFARLCDNVPRGNLCIQDSKLITCYESCTTDLCNSGNPSPIHLPTVSYAGEEIPPRDYKGGYAPIQNYDTLGRPYKSHSFKGASNIKSGPRREMWLATKRQGFFSTQARKFPFIVTPTPLKAANVKKGNSNTEMLKLGMQKKANGSRLEAVGENRKMMVSKDLNAIQANTRPELAVNHITSNPGNKFTSVADQMKTSISVQNKNDFDVSGISLTEMAAAEKVFVADYSQDDGSETKKDEEKVVDYTVSETEEESMPSKEANDYVASIDLALAETKHEEMLTKESIRKNYEHGLNPNYDNTKDYEAERKEQNDARFLDDDDSEPLYEEEFEVDPFGEIGRGSDGVVIWPRSAIEEELEREELREDEVPMSNMIVEEDREEGLIQTFRANTTKTTQDADKVAAAKAKVNESKPKVNSTSQNDGVALEEGSQGKKGGKTEAPRVTSNDVDHSKKSTQKDVSMGLDNIIQQIKDLKTTGKKTETTKSVHVTKSTTTTSTKLSKPEYKQTTTVMKRNITIPLTHSGTRQTTLPYIWRDNSSWNKTDTQNKTVSDKEVSDNGNRNTNGSTAKHTKHHKNVQLTDFLELHASTMSPKSSMDVNKTLKKSNQTTLAQRDTRGHTKEDIFLDESLTENLKGFEEDLVEKTEAELTGSRAAVTSRGSFVLCAVVLFVCLMGL
ncbi:uncharacterized protein LOC125372489 [Haliotis rufescens]|uniref:uncharacterized protein LOC125372489 n=1 Tax=Haliotis rufescens TaxID=6454 RepID=UPI00201EE500|nr:uncharacterized protein LOC125372489 [Haliotis rufescens]